MEEAAKAYMKVHETQEDVRSSEMAAIIKRQEAQALMETAEARAATTGLKLFLNFALGLYAGWIRGKDPSRVVHYEYWEAIDSTFGLQGGFIWDWVDQVETHLLSFIKLGYVLKENANGSKYWAYGGDFGVTPNDLNFCLNGLIWPDRIPHPALNGDYYNFFA
uniref:beta-galactosidase n=1 Tax=Lactuca sativa TaxID=4236 RepID=A0A9R1XX31_LACSA|nr:hypothetical protein LSAT_V11C100044800 [Lactuca sativa]